MEFPIVQTKYDHVNKFINTLAPIVCNEWLRRRNLGNKTISPAVVLAQAGLESGWNLEAKTLFGIKGDGETLDTSEFINGEYVHIKDSFKSYPGLAEAVQGYYELMQWENYDDATSATTVEGELFGLTNAVNGTDRDAEGNQVGYNYATSPDYYANCLSIVNNFGLTVFNTYVESIEGNSEPDVSTDAENTNPIKSVEELADEIYRGEWGNNPERRERITEAGYDYEAAQARMMEKYYPELNVPVLNVPVNDTPAEDSSAPTDFNVGDKVRFTGSTDINGTPLKYTDREYEVYQTGDDFIVLSIDGQIYARVARNEVEHI